jgi:hypothetical protein
LDIQQRESGLWYDVGFPIGDGFRNRIAPDAASHWSDISSTDGFSFSAGAGGDRNVTWGSCSQTWDSFIFTPWPNSVYAVTGNCGSQGVFMVGLNSNLTWYTATDQNPSNKPSLVGVATHELGHASNGWNLCTDGLTSDPCQGKHFDNTYNTVQHLCNVSSYPAIFHTMCFEAPTSETWRWKSLETHDIDTFQSAYPP